MLKFIVLLVLITYVISFQTYSNSNRLNRVSINMMKGKRKGVKKTTPEDANFTRKLKRAIRSSDSTTFTSAVLTAKTESFLKETGPGRLYDNLLHLIKQQASKLKVTVNSDYAAIPKVVLPDLVEIASGDDTFKTLVTAVTAAGLASTLKGHIIIIIIITVIIIIIISIIIVIIIIIIIIIIILLKVLVHSVYLPQPMKPSPNYQKEL